MSDLRGGPPDDSLISALNAEIGETLKRKLGPEAVLPANLQRLMLALAKAD